MHFTQVVAGLLDTCALRDDGAAWCWGWNGYGEAGLGAPGMVTTPMAVTGGNTYVSIAMTSLHACAIDHAHDLYCWGLDNTLQLGSPSPTGYSAQPILVPPAGGWSAVAAGNVHTCAIAVGSSGALYCWGSNAWGELGDGTTVDHGAQGSIVMTDAKAIATGPTSTCAIDATGALACFGDDRVGQLGDGQRATRKAPASVIGGPGAADGWAQIAQGYGPETCGVSASGRAWCWGAGGYDEIGDGKPVERTAPSAIAGSWSAIAVGNETACALANGVRSCWGDGSSGQLGDGAFAPQSTPVSDAAHQWSEIALGSGHACALDNANIVWCWGDNSTAQLGNGTTGGASSTPAAVGGTWLHVWTGWAHSCAETGDTSLWCWGQNASGELGNGAASGPVASPSPVVIKPSAWRALSLGFSHACAVDAAGQLWCWGANNVGQLGDGTNAAHATPELVGSASDWTTVSAGYAQTCGIRAPGALYCWGSNARGQLGTNVAGESANVPTRIGTSVSWVEATTGVYHTCARDASGALWCWGDDEWGETGTGAGAIVAQPAQVGAAHDWIAVRAQGRFTCGLEPGGALSCWGENAGGQLALPSWKTTPATVAP
jgi:alpha-tubulin suppressor-like RCC1 family protein